MNYMGCVRLTCSWKGKYKVRKKFPTYQVFQLLFPTTCMPC